MGAFMYCKKCEARLRDDDKFCPACGAKIEPTSPRHAAPDSRVPSVTRRDVSSCSKVSTNSQKSEQDDKISPASLRKMSEKHLSHEPKHVVVKLAVAWIALIVVAFVVVWNTRGFFSTASNSTASTGNTAGNIENNGLVAEQDGWTYYVNQDSTGDYSIRRISSEGKSESVIWSSSSTAPLRYLNVVDDEAYFVRDSSSGDSICKVDLNGKNEATIWSTSEDDAPTYLSVIGNEAYFVSGDSICKIATDGSGEKTIYKGSAAELNIVGSEVYFVGKSSICAIGTDGSGEKTVYTGQAGDLNVIDGKAYFISGNALSGYSICKVGLDGKNESTVWSATSKIGLNSLNVVGDIAYFMSYNSSTTKYSICKVGTDGKDEETVWSASSSMSPLYLSIAGGEMYFLNANNNAYNNSLYRVDTDGKNERTV
jgi:hypothetical protein